MPAPGSSSKSEDSDHNSELVLRRIRHATVHATVEDDRLEFLQPDDEVSVAISRMVACEYSQMPVGFEPSNQSDESAQLHGVVTWRSITRALLDGDVRSTVCKEACDPPERFHRFSADTSVVDVVGVLFEHDFILTYDTNDKLFGIMTSADLVRWSDQHAMGLVEVRRVELRLRKLTETFARNKGTRREKMNFRHYEKRLLKDNQAWSRMVKSGLWRGVNRQEVLRLFREATKARNAIVHFKCEDQPDEYQQHRKKLTQLVRLLDFGADLSQPAKADSIA